MASFEERLRIEHFHQMEELEASFYSRDLITPASEAYRWYTLHPHSTVAAKEDGFARGGDSLSEDECPQGESSSCEGGRIIGFVNLLPVRTELFERVLRGSFNDADLVAEDILPLSALDDMPFGLFLSCIVVDRDHQGKGLARELLAKAMESYFQMDAIEAHRVVTDNATAQGERFSQSLGFEYVGPSDHGTQIYAIEVEALLERLGIAFR